jgi:hypothetical protein
VIDRAAVGANFRLARRRAASQLELGHRSVFWI